jgi:c(7)-type cytochrome triheme protein
VAPEFIYRGNTSMFMHILQLRRGMVARLLIAVALGMFALPSLAQRLSLAKDGVHDAANPGLKMLQEPRDALDGMPPDDVGNRVRWVKALEEGKINPRTNILPDTPIRVLNLDVLLKRTAEAPMVLFPHKQHTEWLDCSNCHESLFKYKAGSTKEMNMFAILQGEFCGRCHGAVAFPLTECKRCHSVLRK